MSVFGGDSWAREAHHGKRRLDDLLLSSQSTTTTSSSSSSYKKLSNGKLACLVCPNTPVLDSPLMLSVHSKGSRHVAAEKRMRERDLEVQAEKNKRNALSTTTTTTCVVAQSKSKPLIDRARSAIDAGAERSEKSGVCGGSQVDESREERRKRREKELEFTAAGWPWEVV